MTAFMVALAASTWLLAPARHHLRAPPHPRARAGAVPLCTAEPTRLMLVDDQDGLRNAVRSYLVHNGFKCDAFSGVAAAFDAISKGLLPDLIITDVLMPDIDGYQLLRRVRADPRLGGVPVVLLTAKGFSSDRIDGFNAGASAYVSKPFEPEELLSVINALLANARLAEVSVSHGSPRRSQPVQPPLRTRSYP